MHLMLAQFPFLNCPCAFFIYLYFFYIIFVYIFLYFSNLPVACRWVFVVLSGCSRGWALVVAIAVLPTVRQRQLLTFNDAALYFNTLCLLGMLMLMLFLLPATCHPPEHPFSTPTSLVSPASTCHKQRFENF